MNSTSSTPSRRTQPPRRQSHGGNARASPAATPTRRKPASARKRKRTPEPNVASPRSRGIKLDPKQLKALVFSPEQARELRRIRRNAQRDFFLTTQYLSSKSKQNMAKRRKITEDQSFDDGPGHMEESDDSDRMGFHHPDDFGASNHDSDTNDRRRRRESPSRSSSPPRRRASTARRRLSLEEPHQGDELGDENDFHGPAGDEPDFVAPPRRAAATPRRGGHLLAPLIDEQVDTPWTAPVYRPESKIVSKEGKVVVVSVDASGHHTLREAPSLPEMSRISASSDSLAMISKRDKQLFVLKFEDIDSQDPLRPFSPFPTFAGLPCLDVENREDGVATVFEDGRAAVFIFESQEVKYFSIEGERIKQIQLFDAAVALLTESGFVYVAGWPHFIRGTPQRQNAYEFEHENWNPTKIEPLAEIVSIAFSDRHALALSRRGFVFGFGVNGEGQLGLGPDADQFVGEPVRIPGLNAVVHICAGMFQSAFLDATGQLYTCGSGKHMTTAQSNQENIYVPTKVQRIEGKSSQEVLISAGFSGFQFEVLSAWGRVFTCGFDASSYAPGRDNDFWNATLHLFGACSHLAVSQCTGRLPRMALLLSNPHTHVIADDE